MRQHLTVSGIALELARLISLPSPMSMSVFAHLFLGHFLLVAIFAGFDWFLERNAHSFIFIVNPLSFLYSLSRFRIFSLILEPCIA